MTRVEIQTYLAKKVEAEWEAYRQATLQLSSLQVFARAHEIHATRTCCEELILNAGEYHIDHLAYLLTLPTPLETVREQWLTQENEELEVILSRVLQSVQAQGTEQNHGLEMEE